MPQLKTYDVFIRHAWNYHEDYFRMVRFLNDALYFNWRNYSVPEHDPIDGNSNRMLKEALKRQMRPANIVLILAGMYAAHSGWIDFEIEFSSQIKKPMIGIRPWGQQRVPKIVSDNVDVMVGWQTDSIISAIRKYSL